MRRYFQRDEEQNEEESITNSFIDLLLGLVFVFVIVLISFSQHLIAGKQKNHALTKKLLKREQLLNTHWFDRARLLVMIKNRLAKKNIHVSIIQQSGILRLTENTIYFKSGQAYPTQNSQIRLRKIADTLAYYLPCYVHSPHPPSYCSTKTWGTLEAIFIEGNTDNMPFQSQENNNWLLSAQRAIAVYRLFLNAQPRLQLLKNAQGETLFSATGYGPSHPLVYHPFPTSDARNRRIDIRFIMTPPQTTIVSEFPIPMAYTAKEQQVPLPWGIKKPQTETQLPQAPLDLFYHQVTASLTVTHKEVLDALHAVDKRKQKQYNTKANHPLPWGIRKSPSHELPLQLPSLNDQSLTKETPPVIPFSASIDRAQH